MKTLILILSVLLAVGRVNLSHACDMDDEDTHSLSFPKTEELSIAYKELRTAWDDPEEELSPKDFACAMGTGFFIVCCASVFNSLNLVLEAE